MSKLVFFRQKNDNYNQHSVDGLEVKSYMPKRAAYNCMYIALEDPQQQQV
jgi:hypothetical protein